MNTKRTITYYITLSLLLVFSISARAQMYYHCDFENAAERSRWTLNYQAKTPPVTLMNEWHMGKPGQFGPRGQHGLFVAPPNNDSAAVYVSSGSCYTIAYRDTILPAGNYSFLCDFRINGGPNAMLQVWWLPKSTRITSANNNAPTNWAANGGIQIGSALYGHQFWESLSQSFTIPQGKEDGRLVFLWSNNASVPYPPSACVDNIYIISGPLCASAPAQLTYSSGNVTWKGGTPRDAYELLMVNTLTDQLDTVALVIGNKCSPTPRTEGYYMIYVRRLCEGDSLVSPWATTSSFVYIKGARCLDYMDLDAAFCFRGPFDNVSRSTSTSRGKVDNGYQSVSSFHTIHYVPGELDPRTKNMLPTIPEGEIASVRLGNWRADNSIDGMGAGEAIEYKYDVKAGQSDIMEIRYAVVMQKPGHNNGTDPHFTLEILDEAGKQLQPVKCFKADFAASSDNPEALIGWNQLESSELHDVEGASGTIIWKPWTLISVSLRDYVGQKLTIRFTTMDCRQSAHWAYAYFTIGCRSGDLQGIACGDTKTDHFDAPEGFNYEWFWEGNPSVCLSTSQRFDITTTSDSIYVVKVISKTSDCYYELTANPNPRYPKVVAKAQTRVANCMNVVDFSEDSYICIINRKTDTIMGRSEEPLDFVSIDYGDGSPIETFPAGRTLSHEFPAEGGTYDVRISASMSDGVCSEDTVIRFVFPDLSPSLVVDDRQWCRSQGALNYKGKKYTNDFSDTTVYVSHRTGCDSIYIVNYHFVDTTMYVQYDTICSNNPPYVFYGEKLSKTGVYDKQLVNAAGCDSIHRLFLMVKPALEIGVEPTYMVCGDGVLDIPFDIKQGRYSGMTVHIGDTAYSFGVNDPISIPMYDETRDVYLRPDLYEVTLELASPDCPVEPVHVKADVKYASFIMYQKHGFVGLYNSDFNTYGFEFDTKFAWYCNDVLLPNDTLAYVRVKDTDWGKKYRVEVTRLDDGKKQMSCPLTYTYGMPQGVEDLVADEDVVAYFDILGRRYATLPSHTGVYVVVYTKHSEKIVIP